MKPIRIESPTGVRFMPPPGHRNIKLTLTYDGKAFSGYQFQPHAVSVQETLNKAWQILAGESVTLYGCSRLDTQVSANHFVLNFYSATTLDYERIVRGLNGILHWNLRKPIGILNAEEAAPDFNSRFDSTGKHYRYLMWYGRGRHALITPRCWPLKGVFKTSDIENFAKLFEGTKDFASYRAQDCAAKTTVRTIHRFSIHQDPTYKELLVADVWGNGFLKNMIRNLVGTAVDAAQGRFTPSNIENSFQHGTRNMMGQCAPGHGLTLQEVFYSATSYENSWKNYTYHKEL